MCIQSFKLCIQLCVDNIYLLIDIHHQLLLTLKNLINHCFYLAPSSLWYYVLIGRISIVFVATAVEVAAIGFLELQTLLEVTPLSIAIIVYVFIDPQELDQSLRTSSVTTTTFNKEQKYRIHIKRERKREIECYPWWWGTSHEQTTMNLCS